MCKTAPRKRAHETVLYKHIHPAHTAPSCAVIHLCKKTKAKQLRAPRGFCRFAGRVMRAVAPSESCEAARQYTAWRCDWSGRQKQDDGRRRPQHKLCGRHTLEKPERGNGALRGAQTVKQEHDEQQIRKAKGGVGSPLATTQCRLRARTAQVAATVARVGKQSPTICHNMEVLKPAKGIPIPFDWASQAQ